MPAKPYRPPFELTPRSLLVVADIMKLVGRYEGLLSPKPQPKLRRQNQIRTVQGSVAIEGNTLSLDQITAILDDRRVVGPAREIAEVRNAIDAYAAAGTFDPDRPRDLLRAHALMMRGLVGDAGKYRAKGVGVFRGADVAHMAPPAKQVPRLIEDLLGFVRKDRTLHPLVKSAVVHYELEFIHPFSDGNGRMGRFWQHVILSRFHPIFEHVPVESVILVQQARYYRVLGECDKAGSSTAFVEFSLDAILASLEDFLGELRPSPATATTRLALAREEFAEREFSRRDYLARFPTISTATASRDLREGLAAKTLARTGEKALARYRFR